MRKCLALMLLAVLLMSSLRSAWAHANLLRSEPPANATLEDAPREIRLWFSEPLEPEFSRITVRDSAGAVIATSPAQVDGGEGTQMAVQPGDLAEGIYSVTWRVLSTDGHSTEGSFAFGIGVAVTALSTLPPVDETIPVDGTLIRWFNLVAMSLAVGSVGFWLFVWLPCAEGSPVIERRLRRVMVGGWVLLGVASVMSLLLQASVAAQVPVLQAAGDPALGGLLFHSRYGGIWLLRMGLWLVMGLSLWLASDRPRWHWLALGAGLLLLLTTSLYSHASALQRDMLGAVAGDWLHLSASALWIGGLTAFFVVIGTSRFREYLSAPDSVMSRLAGYFSNFARVAVFGLIVSGLYAAWLHVGSVEALTTTVYGQALGVKLVLVVPLLLIAAVNLLATQRRLRAGDAVWTARLRGLVGMEIALTVGILAAVGVMTAIAPARTVMAVRVAASSQPVIYPIFEMQTQNDLMAHLEIMPGAVGENEFLVSLYDAQGRVVNDASLIRLRFESLEQNLGESELRPELREDGIFYAARGANLSIPGLWRIRMTVQRPEQFDSVLDFRPSIAAASVPPPPVIESAPPVEERGPVTALAGIGLLGVGGFFAARRPRPVVSGSNLLCAGAGAAGLVLLLTAVSAFSADTSLRARDAWARPMPAGMVGVVYLTLENNTPQLERLVGADTAVAANVELHQTVIENQIASMRFIPTLDIPAFSQLAIESGGYHLMLNSLQQDLTVGDTFALTLHFASGAFVTVDVVVGEG